MVYRIKLGLVCVILLPAAPKSRPVKVLHRPLLVISNQEDKQMKKVGQNLKEEKNKIKINKQALSDRVLDVGKEIRFLSQITNTNIGKKLGNIACLFHLINKNLLSSSFKVCLVSLYLFYHVFDLWVPETQSFSS